MRQLSVEILYDFRKGAFPVDQVLRRMFQKKSQGGGLFGIGDLFQITEIHLLFTRRNRLFPCTFTFSLSSGRNVCRTGRGSGRPGHDPAAFRHDEDRSAGRI